jgi:anti-anti-sigma factor
MSFWQPFEGDALSIRVKEARGEDGGAAVVRIAGPLSTERVPLLARAVELAAERRERVALDLSDATVEGRGFSLAALVPVAQALASVGCELVLVEPPIAFRRALRRESYLAWSVPINDDLDGALSPAPKPRGFASRHSWIRHLELEDPEVAFIQLFGCLDAAAAATIIELSRRLARSGARHVIFDASEVKRFHSSPLGAFVRVADDARKRGGLCLFFGVPGQMKIVFDMLGFEAFFTVVPDRAAALERARRAPAA